MKFAEEELLNYFKDNNYEKLNQFISICFYETENDNLDRIIKHKKKLLDKIKDYIRQKVRNNMNEEDKYVLNFFSDEKLGIPKIEKIFIDYLFNFPILDFIDDYFILFNMLNKQDNEIYKPKNSKDYIFKIKSFSDLKKEIEEILNLFGIYSLELFENKLNELKNFISEIYKNVEEEKKKVPNILKEQVKKDIRERLNNPSNEKINEIMNNEEFKKKIKEEEKKI